MARLARSLSLLHKCGRGIEHINSAFEVVPHYRSMTSLNLRREPLITNSAKIPSYY